MHCFALHVVPTGADVKGRVKKPKLDKDLAKLKVLCCAFCGKRRGLASYRLFFSFPWQDLFAFCEDANFREVPVPVVAQFVVGLVHVLPESLREELLKCSTLHVYLSRGVFDEM